MLNPYLSELVSRSLVGYLWISCHDVRQRVGFHELFRELMAPPSLWTARYFMKNIGEDAEYLYFTLRGYAQTFCYPKSLPERDLAYVVYENFRPEGWHFYDIPQTRVKKDDVIVDCGAAEGMFTFLHKDKAKAVYAIEPLPLFVRSLRKMFANDKNVIVIDAAASEKAGSLFLKENSVGSVCTSEPGCGKNTSVNTVTIDSLFFDKGVRMDYLKADVEGHEELVLRGALKSIRAFRPRLAVAVYHEKQDYKTMVSLVQSVAPEYKYLAKGISGPKGSPVLLHMWA